MHRIPLFLTIVFAASLFACGGSSTDTTQTPTAGQPGATEAAKPPPKPQPKASPEALQIKREYKEVSVMMDEKAKKETATTKALMFAGQTLPPDAIFWRALLWKEAEDYTKAAEDFGQFVTVAEADDPNAANGYVWAADMWLNAGDVTKATKYVNDFKAKFPTQGKELKTICNKIGNALMTAGKFEEAIPHLESAVSAGHAIAGQELVGALQILGKYDQARTKAKELEQSFKGGIEGERYQMLSARAEKIGKKAPSLTIAGWHDNFDPADDLGEKAYIMYFWSPSPSRWRLAESIEKKLMPLYEQFRDQGFTILGVSEAIHRDLANLEGGEKPDMSNEEEVKQLATWAENQKTPTPWHLGLLRDEAMKKNWGFHNMPNFFVVDAKGIYRYFRSGAEEETYTILEKVLARVMSGK